MSNHLIQYQIGFRCHIGFIIKYVCNRARITNLVVNAQHTPITTNKELAYERRPKFATFYHRVARVIVIFFPLCASIIYIYRLAIMLLLNNFAFHVQLDLKLWTQSLMSIKRQPRISVKTGSFVIIS